MDQPLCSDCCAKVQREVDAAVRETEREIEAYQAALRRLSAAEEAALPDEEFKRQLAVAEEEEERERCFTAVSNLLAAKHCFLRLPHATCMLRML